MREKGMEQKIQKALDYIRTEGAVWIGEDGSACALATTKRGAWIKIRALFKRDCGVSEAQEVKLEEISVGWMRLPTEEDRERWGDQYEWFVEYAEKDATHFPVWVYRG